PTRARTAPTSRTLPRCRQSRTGAATDRAADRSEKRTRASPRWRTGSRSRQVRQRRVSAPLRLDRRRFEHRTERRETEGMEQLAQARFRLIEMTIVPEPPEPAGGQPRLIRIDLPWMKIENRRPCLARVDAADAPARPGVWKDPEVSATRHRQVHPGPSSR